MFLEFHGSDIRWAFCRKPYLDMDMPLINEKYRKEIKNSISSNAFKIYSVPLIFLELGACTIIGFLIFVSG